MESLAHLPNHLPKQHLFRVTYGETAELSKRELEVLGMIAKGYEYDYIADKLFISFLTLKTHVRNIFSKLGVNKRGQAVEKAIQQNLI